MGSKPRLKSTTIWALEDIMALCRRALGPWQRATARARSQMDPVQLASLAVLRHQLAEIERLARLARNGRYEDAAPAQGSLAQRSR